ncbi:MAG: hypothetical protein CMK59_14195 [Proteobacteria bacterium]|nr:hypothetical protein [Pseudomonadota bacterium]
MDDTLFFDPSKEAFMFANKQFFQVFSSSSPEKQTQPVNVENFGSNQEQIAKMQAQQSSATKSKKTLDISRTLRIGSKGDDVKALQAFLGLSGNDVDGHFGKGTKEKVIAWQRSNNLTPDGVVGSGTIAAMNGIKRLYGHSKYHDEEKFVPSFPMMAYHESGKYRSKNDPYAVGAVTNPKKNDDLGGKTYGIYQFESFVHSGGNHKSKAAKGSTVMRFVRWEKNPFGKQMQTIVDKHGIASLEFDALWQTLAAKQNNDFGKAQQDFIRHDKGQKVIPWMKRAKLSDKVQADDAFFDLVLGTLNQTGGLANKTADHIAAMQKKEGRYFSVKEAANILIDHKISNIPNWFKSSPDAHKGILNRYTAEKKAF